MRERERGGKEATKRGRMRMGDKNSVIKREEEGREEREKEREQRGERERKGTER